MIKAPVNEAKTQLTKLLVMVEAGERVVTVDKALVGHRLALRP